MSDATLVDIRDRRVFHDPMDKQLTIPLVDQPTSVNLSFLEGLNAAQLRGMETSDTFLVVMTEGYIQTAVEHPPSIPVQILAGPGSGKTKVSYIDENHGRVLPF
jgi:hypothetical protein